jgi:hypothetical protein
LKCPKMWVPKEWMLLHDSAPVHQLLLVQQLTKHCTVVFPHLFYSIDLILRIIFTSFHG